MNIPDDPARKTPYLGLLAFSGLATLAAVLTLVPWEAASWPNLWGYKSLCTFAPGATVACALLAAISCVVRNRLVRGERQRPLVPVLVLVVLVGLLAWSTVAWAEVKAQYADSLTAPTEASGSHDGGSDEDESGEDD